MMPVEVIDAAEFSNSVPPTRWFIRRRPGARELFGSEGVEFQTAWI